MDAQGQLAIPWWRQHRGEPSRNGGIDGGIDHPADSTQPLRARAGGLTPHAKMAGIGARTMAHPIPEPHS